MTGDEDAAGGLGGIAALEHGVDVDDAGGFGDAGNCASGDGDLRGLDEVVPLDVEAVVAGGGDAGEFGEIESEAAMAPVLAGGRCQAGEGAAVVESDQLGDGGLDAIGGDVAEGIGDAEVGRGGRDGLLGGGEGDDKADSEQR